MKLPLYNQQGKEVGEINLPKEVFGLDVNADLLHQAVVAQMANSRITFAHTKKRSDVRGGGKKPWKQKGTGRARHSSIRSPIWAGGGVVFGPRNEKVFSKKINKKMKKKALLMSLSSKAKDRQVIALEAVNIEKGKTKELASMVKMLHGKMGDKNTASTLLVLPKSDQLVNRAASNIKRLKTILADSLNVVDVLSYKNLVISKDSIDIIKKTYVA